MARVASGFVALSVAWCVTFVGGEARAVCCGSACCNIASVCYGTGAPGPSACLECNPSKSSFQWSAVAGTCFIAGTCYAADDPNPSNPCQACKPATSQTAWSNNPVACDDGDLCTTSDACSGGTCNGTPKDCSGFDGVCLEGVCQVGTGTCIAQALGDGASCDDGDVCTSGDDCQGGVCTPGTDLCVDGSLPPPPDAGPDATTSTDDDAGSMPGGGGAGSAATGGSGTDAGGAGGGAGSDGPGGGGAGGSARDDAGAAGDGAGDAGNSGGGCGCRVTGAARGRTAVLPLALFALVVASRVRRRRG